MAMPYSKRKKEAIPRGDRFRRGIHDKLKEKRTFVKLERGGEKRQPGDMASGRKVLGNYDGEEKFMVQEGFFGKEGGCVLIASMNKSEEGEGLKSG